MSHHKSKSPPMLMPIAAAVWLASGHVSSAPPTWVEGHILVKPRAGLPDQALYNILERSQGQSVARLDELDIHIVRVPPQAEDQVIAALSRNPHIEFAEKDILAEQAAETPNDTYYPNAWHLTKMQVPLAWDVTQGSGVTVAILDAGVAASHPDLQGQLVSGWNVYSNSGDTSPVNDHGTKAAGVVAALSNNGFGVTSIAAAAMLMPIRITDSTSASASAIANGITWAADHGARVANISYVGIDANATIRDAAQYMRNRGGVVVNSAGNTGGDYGFSDNPYMIAVSATTSSDTKASWSSYGQHVDVAAPGEGIWTTTASSSYGAVSGTSFSSPAAAAVAALIISTNPSLSPSEVESVLENSADDLGSPDYFGAGRVNAARAVEMAAATSTGDSQAPSVGIISPTTGSVVSGIVTIDVSASDNQSVSAVTLYAGGGLVGTDTTSPYRFSWDSTSVADGAISLTAYGSDAANNEGSASVSVTVSNGGSANEGPDQTPPTVAFSSPTDGASVSGTEQIVVLAGDDRAVVSVELTIDGAAVASTSGSSLSYSWNTRKISSGAHTLAASARDAAGNSTARSIQVTVGASSKARNRAGGAAKG